MAVALTPGRALHGVCDVTQAEVGDSRHGEDGQADEAEDAVPGRVGILDHVGDEGDDQADGDEDRAAGREVVEVLQSAAEHADAERQQQRRADHRQHARKPGALPGEEELVEDGGGEEDERTVKGDPRVAVGVQRVVDHGAADEAGADEVADVADVEISWVASATGRQPRQ